MTKLLRLVSGLFLAIFSSQAFSDEIRTVRNFDVSRYLGTWNEIASIPMIFQTGCTCTQAKYSLRDDKDVAVVNSCRLGGPAGFPLNITGRARIPDVTDPARLKVSFFGPFEADYFVLAVANDYSYALVGSPSRTNLWILARERTLEPEIIDSLKTLAASQGFPVNELATTQQQGCE